MPPKYTSVSAFLSDLPEPRRSEVEALREIVIGSSDGLVEHIKWNSPSYIFNGEDRVTVNAHGRDAVRLILHAGPTTVEDRFAVPIFDQDPHGLLEWHSNIRASIALSGTDVIAQKRNDIRDLLAAWFHAAL
jgi:hypothetical protein